MCSSWMTKYVVTLQCPHPYSFTQVVVVEVPVGPNSRWEGRRDGQGNRMTSDKLGRESLQRGLKELREPAMRICARRKFQRQKSKGKNPEVGTCLVY